LASAPKTEGKKLVLLREQWIEGRGCLWSLGLMGKTRKTVSVWANLSRQSVGSNRKKANEAEERSLDGNKTVLCGQNGQTVIIGAKDWKSFKDNRLRLFGKNAVH
jgi:hypothetical protein